MPNFDDLRKVHQETASKIVGAGLKYAQIPDKLNALGDRLMRHLDAFETAEFRDYEKNDKGNYELSHLMGFITLFENHIDGLERIVKSVSPSEPYYQQLMDYMVKFISGLISEYQSVQKFIDGL